MSGSIKVRTVRRGGTLTVRMLVRHPMEVGGRRDNGEEKQPRFITEISCAHNGEIVMLGHWGGGIAKNPYLSFTFDGANPGDELVVRWTDNQGASDEFTTQIS